MVVGVLWPATMSFFCWWIFRVKPTYLTIFQFTPGKKVSLSKNRNAQRTAHFYLHTDANPTSIEMVVLLTTTIHSTYTLSCGLLLFSQHIKIHLVAFLQKMSQFFLVHFIIT